MVILVDEVSVWALLSSQMSNTDWRSLAKRSKSLSIGSVLLKASCLVERGIKSGFVHHKRGGAMYLRAKLDWSIADRESDFRCYIITFFYFFSRLYTRDD